MLILLDCRPLLLDQFNEENGRFIISCAARLSKEQGVEWLFLLNNGYRGGLSAQIPSAHILTRQPFPFRIGRRIWSDWQLSRVVKSNQPDLIMTARAVYARGRKETRVLFCFSEKDKSIIISTGGKAAGRIIVVPPAADEHYQPIGEEEKEKVKQDHAEGKEYFLTIVTGARKGELVGLLKAFSLFKKRQRSNMQLVLAGAEPGTSGRVPGSFAGRGIVDGLGLDSYKYRSSIHVLDHPAEEELIRLTGAAYAFISPFKRSTPGVAILNAWAAGTPVIANRQNCLPEMGSDAVLVIEAEDPVSLADGLMRVYKDESLRSRLLEKGRLRLLAFPLDRATARVWEGILRAMS